MPNFAVIGSSYGDEGKGLMVDYLARKHGGLVIRYSGGAQAGHTVVTPDGLRHVFHHFGSGTLAGSPTFLARFFIVNPILFRREMAELNNKGISPVIGCHPDARVTLPFDMAINQELEKMRGDARHGSVGVGIWETVKRNSHLIHQLSVDHFRLSREGLSKRIYGICQEYAIPYGESLGLDRIKEHPAFSRQSIERFIDDCRFFIRSLSIVKPSETNIFEGSQGLLLDQDYAAFPEHSTPSNVGMKNIAYIANNMGIDKIQAIYVTRSYTTRHGVGYLRNECDLGLSGTDKTNEDHEYQGKLRYAKLDPLNIKVFAQTDFSLHLRPGDTMEFAVTCLDQYNDRLWEDMNPRYMSSGETANDVIDTYKEINHA